MRFAHFFTLDIFSHIDCCFFFVNWLKSDIPNIKINTRKQDFKIDKIQSEYNLILEETVTSSKQGLIRSGASSRCDRDRVWGLSIGDPEVDEGTKNSGLYS